jgi:hypothetical protein
LFFFSPSLSSFSFSFLLKRRQIGFSCSFLVSPPQLRTNGDNDDGCTPRTEEEGQMPPQRRLDSDRDTIKGRVTTKEKERERRVPLRYHFSFAFSAPDAGVARRCKRNPKIISLPVF